MQEIQTGRITLLSIRPALIGGNNSPFYRYLLDDDAKIKYDKGLKTLKQLLKIDKNSFNL